MKSKLKICIKIFGVIRINSIIVNISRKVPYLDKSNKKVTGEFKDEASGIPNNEL